MNDQDKPYTRKCFACGTLLRPYTLDVWTGHEFQCGKVHPNKIPPEWKEHQRQTLEWEKRSIKAKQAASERRRAK
jgi:hypothetical protein